MVAAIREPAAVQALRDQGRTIAWLARKMGQHRSHVRRQLIGQRRMSPTQAQRMADLTGLPVALFLAAYQAPEREAVA